ncbi:hypothetical protein E8E14_012886 [Neopestalotiopsis sp. 37M]|nr:hypothetical protein E8E14_012886 [Neopestalotiopsis sp. 37M]
MPLGVSEVGTVDYASTLIHNVATVSPTSTLSGHPSDSTKASQSSVVSVSDSGLPSRPSESSFVSFSSYGVKSSENASPSSVSFSEGTNGHSGSVSTTCTSSVTHSSAVVTSVGASSAQASTGTVSGYISSAVVSSDTVSSGAVSSGTVSSDSAPSGTASSGAVSSGSVSSSTVSSGAASSDVASTGTVSSGSASSGTASSGTASSGTASSGIVSSSSVSAGSISSGTASTQTISTANTSSGTASSSAISESASSGTASTGTASTGTASTGTASTGTVSSGTASSVTASSDTTSSGTASSGTASTGTASTSSASSGTASTGTSSSASVSSASVSSSSASSSSVSSTTSSSTASPTFGNTASTRSEWGDDFDISTDYYTEVPETGVTREYWFELTEGTVAPDGVTRYGQTINGSFPGPTITADWGDNVIVHLTNALTTSVNGTSLHFHGIRQNYTNDQDGVSSITQCPVPPGNSVTYKWRATQYGTSWYHSHFALQAWQGVFGPIVINGPATANYDVDAGIVFLNDWTHQTPDELFIQAETSGPPNQDNGLINGMNVYGDDDDSSQTGERWNTTFTPGTSYRLRIVNGAIDSSFKFSIDNHTLTVIASDFVPIVPYTAEIITLGGGQRYDVIVTADQAAVADSFWMRSIPMASCSTNTMKTNIKGAIYYEGSNTLPTTTGYDYTDACDDETDNLVPYVSQTVTLSNTGTVEVASVSPYNGGGFRWFLNSTTMITDWADPSLLQLYNNVTEFEDSNAVITLDEANVWVYLVIETNMPVSHPIHLHGHDFVILAQGSGSFDDSITLNTDNPPRRDVAMLPGSGYVAIAFYTDNPGAWLMHCHIGWHTSEGFALQFIERSSEIMETVDTDGLQDTCEAWSEYQTAKAIVQEDSGI